MQQLRWYETLYRRMVDAHIQNTIISRDYIKINEVHRLTGNICQKC